MSTTKKNKLPALNNEHEEQTFWTKEDSTIYIDWSRAQTVVMPNLKPTLKSISLRLPEPLLERIKSIAAKRDVPYQSLIKMLLAEKVNEILQIKE